MSTTTDIERMTAFSKQVFEAAQYVIETMRDGDRIQIKQLAQTVGLVVAKDPKDILGFVTHYAHHTTLAYVTRGKHGGIVKGTKRAKIIKAGKKTKLPFDQTSSCLVSTTDGGTDDVCVI
jgi:hypothetical protein